jgi:hypothetical protein
MKILFGLFLFGMYFCGGCWLIHTPGNKKNLEGEGEPADICQNSSACHKEEGNSQARENLPEALLEETQESQEIEPASAEETIALDISLLEEIDFRQLSLTACRAIARRLTQTDKNRLGITQKVNSKDKPVEQMQREIRSRFRRYPNEVGPVIAELANTKARVKQDNSVSIRKTTEDRAATHIPPFQLSPPIILNLSCTTCA